jgi:hypothetical protein
MRFGCRVFVFCTILALTSRSPAFSSEEETQYDEMLTKEFSNQAAARWADYIEQTKRLQGSFSYTVVQSDGTQNRVTTEIKKGTENRLALKSTSQTTPPKENAKEATVSVDGFNPDYGFSLRRANVAMPWVLTALVDRQEVPSAVVEKSNKTADSAVNGLLYVTRESMPQMLKQVEFRVIGCRHMRASGDELVLVDFDYPHDDLRRSEVQGGSLVLDPSRFWCLRSFDVRFRVQTGGQGVMSFEVTKWRDSDGFPVPVAAVRSSDGVEDNVRYKVSWHYDYDLSIPDKLPPDGDFTLSAYGLPEPKMAGRPIPLYVWAAAVGLCCVMVGVLLRWKATRGVKNT